MKYLEGDIAQLLDGQQGFAKMVKFNGDAALREDAVLLNFDWDFFWF